ncbi:relaxase/mobilization nuclease RlxS [Sphingomonas sp. UYP23]
MADDNDFEPRLGRQKSGGGKHARKYLSRVLAATNLARGGALSPGRSAGFSGSRYGRGAGVGRLLASRGSGTALQHRRVIIKASIVKLAGKGLGAATAHLRYLQRDGTTREGSPGALYGREIGVEDGAAFRSRGTGDRHQFRFIVSPEDGAEYDDLKPLTRRLMERVEQDLGTKLDWVAVDHFNTGHPHTHIVVRGTDATGKDLLIASDYLTSGMRERAAELLDLDLGPRSARTIENGRRAEIGQERLTSIDRSLLQDASADRIVVAQGRNDFDQTLRAGRLATLTRMGLAEPIGAGRFRLAEDLADTLRRMGERGDIIRTMQRDISRAALGRPVADQVVYEPAASTGRAVTGKIVARGLAHEHADRHYLVIDATDGRSHYVAIGKGENVEPVPIGTIVRIEPRRASVREVDRTIAAVAAASGGRYDIDLHLRHDQSATEKFAEMHVRRLEAMRRGQGGVTREPSGRWTIAPNHLQRVEAWESTRLRDRPVTVTILSARPLDRLVDSDAATWLDREAVAPAPEPLRDAGFGREVADAQSRRRQWLIGQGLAEESDGAVTYQAGLIATLQRRELLKVAGQLSSELDLPFVEATNGARIEGVLRRQVDLVSGRFAVVERSRDFTLVPWRPVLDPHVGKAVSGFVRGDGVSWTIGRGRGGPTIG